MYNTKNKNGGHKSNYIINDINKHSNQKAKIVRLDPNECHLKEIYLRLNDTNRMKVKAWKRYTIQRAS